MELEYYEKFIITRLIKNQLEELNKIEKDKLYKEVYIEYINDLKNLLFKIEENMK